VYNCFGVVASYDAMPLKSETDTTPLADKDAFPFFHQDDQGRLSREQITEQERKQTAYDWEDAKYMIDYRRNSGWDAYAKRGMIVYNVVQTAKPDDEVSRIFLGYTRTQIDRGIDQMNGGEPDFTFEPYGPSDSKKTIIWKHLMKKVLSDSNYLLHQDRFLRDYFVMGCGVFEVYVDYPTRTLRIPNADGTFKEKVVRDKRRPRVGIRALNPLNCWRSPSISDASQVPSCLKRRVISWDLFTQEYGRATLLNGELKYKNLDKISKGKSVVIYEYQNELTDGIRMYAESFCSEEDKYAITPPERFGTMIYDKSLKIHQTYEDGKLIRCEGMNLLGMCSLRWGTYFDAYDKNCSGEHSVYGVGLAQRIEGEDMVLQTIFNIQIDNYRWANAVALNYEGNSADSYIDVDANRLVGGELIDGRITPQPLGIYRPNDFGSMKEVLDGSVIPATGINHNQITGDTSKTAFEFAQRIKASTESAEQRLKRLESETFKPCGLLLLSGALVELTVDEWEAMTEQDAEMALQAIKEGTATVDDYKDLTTDKPQRRVKEYIKIKGEKIREDFTKTKKRQLQYNADLTKNPNTLVYDDTMDEETSNIPVIGEYVYPMGYLENDLQMDVIVDTKRNLGDRKAQDATNFKAATDFILQLKQFWPQWEGADPDKLALAALEFGEINPDDIMVTEKGDEEMQALKAEMEHMKSLVHPSPPNPNEMAMQATGQAPQQAPTSSYPGAINPLGQGLPANAGALGGVAQGSL